MNPRALRLVGQGLALVAVLALGVWLGRNTANEKPGVSGGLADSLAVLADTSDLPADSLAPPGAQTTGRPAEGPAPTEPGRAITAPSGLVVPVAGVRPEDLSDTFNDARSEGRVHNAMDIMAPRGTPVLAAADGTIARLFTSVKGGLTVYQIGTDRRTVFYYAHLDAYAPGLAAGQTVRAGTPLGTVGDSGNAAPGNTHLHFAIWLVDDPAHFWDGATVNPYPALTRGRPLRTEGR